MQRLLPHQEDLIAEAASILEAEFLKIFITIFLDKKLINIALSEVESVSIPASRIFLLPNTINVQDLQNGYYFVENDTHTKLIHVKNGVVEELNIPDNQEITGIIQSIKNKQPKLIHPTTLYSFGIKDEYASLIKTIQTNPGHENNPFSKSNMSLSTCEQKKIFTADGTINRKACYDHCVVIDEKRTNIANLYNLHDIQLSDRENVIIDAVIANAHFQLFTAIKSETICNLLGDLDEDEKQLISQEYLQMYQSAPRKVLSRFKNISLKGAPFYEPTDEFKKNIYLALFELNIDSYITSQINQDAEKIFHIYKSENSKADEKQICNFTMETLFKKYQPHCDYLLSNGNHQKCGELVTLLKNSVAKFESNKKPIKITNYQPKSEALRLIMRRGEGLVKMLNPRFIKFKEILEHNNNQLLISDIKEVDQKWEFTFEQLLNTHNHRPKRQVLPDPMNGFCFSPKLQMQVNPDELEVKSLDHTVMTSSTLLPIDGKMRLFGASHHHAMGILFDIRMCDLVGEHFVFDTDTYTINDWWHNPNATRYHNEFKGFTVNELIKHQKLDEIVDFIRDYNEILAGVSAAAIAAIIFQPAVDIYQSNEKDMDYYEERLNLIYRKLYIAALIGRHIPIIILDAHSGPYQYTLEEQREDLINISKLYPNHSLLEALLSNFESLCEHMPEEFDRKCKPDIITDDLSILQKKKNIKIEIYRLQNETNKLKKKIFTLINNQALLELKHQNDFMHNNIGNTFIENKVLINGLIEKNTALINSLLVEFKTVSTDIEHQALLDFTQKQDKLIAAKCEEECIYFHNTLTS